MEPKDHNVKLVLDGAKLTIEIDLEKSLGLTKKERATMVATTRGWAPVAPGYSLSLNLVKKL